MKKKYIIILSIVAVLIVIILIISSGKNEDEQANIYMNAKKGLFVVNVVTTGELQAENSVKINAPAFELREIRVRQISISKLVPEGTVVDSGDFVAALDPTNVTNNLKEVEDEISKAEGELEKTVLDSSLELRTQRDKIANLKFNLEEAEITLEQSKFESPAVIRQAKINLEKIKREYEQAVSAYDLKVKQAKVNIKQRKMDLAKKQRDKDKIMIAIQKLQIKAPTSGMVIYEKDWDGNKIKEGSNLWLWGEASVATLPDMTTMISKTYVNEIDISQIKVGQKVKIGVDAFPEKEYFGEVKSIANIGEQLNNSDAKVFEVIIKVFGSDPILRPAMTTSNNIITAEFEDVVYIPIEALQRTDSVCYVFMEKGLQRIKQVVLPGNANETHVIIKEGLGEGDKVLLSIPDNPEKYEYYGLELLNKDTSQLSVIQD